MSGHINLQTSWVSALLERAITGAGVGKKKTRKKWIYSRICIFRGRRTSLEMPVEIPPPHLFSFKLIYRQGQEKKLRNSLTGFRKPLKPTYYAHFSPLKQVG